MAEHTPTPWSIYKQPIKGADDAKHELGEQVDLTDPIGDNLFLLEAGGKCPATTGCGPRSEANAAFIVKACNNHDALVAALIKARQRIFYLGAANRDEKHFVSNERDFLPEIDAALQEAGRS